MPGQRYILRQYPHLSLNFSFSRQVTIGKLSDEVLLNTFHYYLDSSPQFWPRLVHICRKWRCIVFASQRALRLRLFCTHQTPFLKTLDWWPALPIVVEYRGSPTLDPPAPEDEDNIVAALEQSDRVRSISLTVTNSLLEKLSAIERPFSELEDLVLLSQDSMPLTLPSGFGRGTRLRSLHLTRITFVTLPQLLYSSRNLVDLQLHEVLNPWLFSPEALTDALGGMVQLQLLSLHFLPTINHIGVLLPSAGRNCVVLPALTCLNFRGITKYLEGIVTGIDAPSLGDIKATLFDEALFHLDFSTLRKFIYGKETQKSPRQADIIFSERSTSVSLTQPALACFKLQVLHQFSDRYQFHLVRICTDFSFFLSNVEDLRVTGNTAGTTRSRLLGHGQFLEAIKLFTNVKSVHVAGDLSTDIVKALQYRWRQPASVLPVLHKLCIPQPGPRHSPLREAVVSFMTFYRLSGHPIAVEYEQLSIDELREIGITYPTTSTTTR